MHKLQASRVYRGDTKPITQFQGQLRYFVRKVAPKSENSKSQRRCVVCSEHRKKKSSVYCCQLCVVVLCFEDCCKLYHMTLNY